MISSECDENNGEASGVRIVYRGFIYVLAVVARGQLGWTLELPQHEDRRGK